MSFAAGIQTNPSFLRTSCKLPRCAVSGIVGVSYYSLFMLIVNLIMLNLANFRHFIVHVIISICFLPLHNAIKIFLGISENLHIKSVMVCFHQY